MTRGRGFSANKIALYLAIMLMFSAFCTDGIKAFELSLCNGNPAGETTLGYPGAGKFFTGSLPLQEQQSVREASAGWQLIQGIRVSRYETLKNGFGGSGICPARQIGITGVYDYGDSCEIEPEAVMCRARDVIVSYIHNQDGQKG